AGGDAHIGDIALGLQLRDAGEQDTGLCHEIAARLDPERELRMNVLHPRESRVELRQVELWLVGPLGHAEPTAHVHDRYVREAPRELTEKVRGLLPVADIQDAAAAVRVQSDDA